MVEQDLPPNPWLSHGLENLGRFWLPCFRFTPESQPTIHQGRVTQKDNDNNNIHVEVKSDILSTFLIFRVNGYIAEITKYNITWRQTKLENTEEKLKRFSKFHDWVAVIDQLIL